MGRGQKPAKSKEAKPPIGRKSSKNDAARVSDLEKRLAEALRDKAEALDQQTATSEILRVISRSPTDTQPVFDAIVNSAQQLLRAHSTGVFLRVGDLVDVVGYTGTSSEGDAELRAQFPRPLLELIGDVPGVARVWTHGELWHDPDSERSSSGKDRRLAQARGFRSRLMAPLRRQDAVIGILVVTRRESGPFSADEIALLQTFADQAVIAIENVRLFNETKEALERQTATSEILRGIASSPTDVQPVFETIVQSAQRLLAGHSAAVMLRIGDEIHLGAYTSTEDMDDAEIRSFWPLSIRTPAVARVFIDGEIEQISDVESDPRLLEITRTFARHRGWRSRVVVPMHRAETVRGAIAVTRREPGPFSEEEIAVLKTFADQAVIAIENVRLFKDLDTRNSQLTEALEQQTATAEILRVISSSPTDIQPVFDAICRSAVRLCGAYGGLITSFDGTLVHLAAVFSPSPDANERVRREYPRRPDADAARDRAILARAVIQIPDTEADSQYTRQVAREFGYRRLLYVPMLRDGQPIGSIGVSGREPGPYTEQQIELLKTFADQAVIAIENVRLFKELETRTQELTQSVGQLTALGDVARAVSSTLDLDTVLSTIVSRAIQLSGTDGGSVYEYDEATEEFSLRASRNLPEAYVEQVRDTRPRKGEGAVGRVAQSREPVQIADISDPAAYESRVRNMLLHIGLRALLAVPLIAEDRLVGALIVMRKRTGTFAAEEVALLQTFATQSALAIQNARLFREIEDKSRQLEVASQRKSEFLANMSHELRTPLNAIIGFSEVLTDRMFGDLNEKQEEYLKDIYASGTHLLSLINDILDLSKIEAGRMELELTDFDLPTALDNALTLVRERAGRRSITLQTSIDERLGEVRADERKIRQVVLNLLSNAIKFTPEGGRIELGAVARDGCVEVSVSDTGVGIAPEDHERVFEEFRQVGTADKKAEGTGLGLTLCRKFIELHGGRICVKSRLGSGSTFTFKVPVHRGE